MVGSSRNFETGTLLLRLREEFANATGASGTNFGQFGLGTTGFIGFRIGGNYGWIRLRLDDTGLNQPFSDHLGGIPFGDGQGYPDKITLIDYAFDDSGAPIHIEPPGTTPEPSSLALLAAGAAGLAAFRRRKATKAH